MILKDRKGLIVVLGLKGSIIVFKEASVNSRE